ncbi:MAG TPA: 3-phosphoserine/phosphohydroxythreonine transaminase [Candidatus Gallimonas intestinigallinarum]|uniref:Phosphoserine aminotransferase n=1 Tax=Candidatus Gallimonas intestinigallinarum TaxID=2838604 RepID=A0A9D2DXN8_9FIRM|nr:3-phosphoserine/phosphohydroxythreonine transaminase [Candidatus Gallimonas intestinigallinarum]
MRAYNFSAGPSTLPLSVLEEAQREFLDFAGTGMSVTEISHRNKAFEAIVLEGEALLRELMHIPDDYAVLFVQGGASTQFAAVPLNLMHKGKADYVVTGNFSKKAWQEGKIYGDAACVASSEDKTYTCIPDVSAIPFREDTDYVHICSNNTIFGTRYIEFPDVKAPLVADMSSEILSREVDVSKFAVIYAGAQKNLAPAGVTIVIAKRDLIGNPLPMCPTMLKWKVQDENKSLYNTPPCFSIYMATLVLRHLKKLGGVKEMNAINEYKAGLLYDFIDSSSFYTNRVEKKYRSIMNVPFVTPSPELDAQFVKEAAANGLVSLKGHRLVGGMRASIYNAMPVDGVKALIEFMKKFERENA